MTVITCRGGERRRRRRGRRRRKKKRRRRKRRIGKRRGRVHSIFRYILYLGIFYI